MLNITVVGLMFALLGNAVADVCSPYGTPDANRCTAGDKSQIMYNDLHTGLKDASLQEHILDYVVNVTLGMYLYIHPCQSLTEAALRLFYGQNSAPDHNSSWWNNMAAVMGSHGVVLVGKRKRATVYLQNDYDLLHSILDQIRLHSDGSRFGADCVQALINEFMGIAASAFKAKYPNFVVPTTHTPATTTHPTHTTLRTTQQDLTVAATTTTTTTTLRPTSTTPAPVAARCSTCTMLACLLSPSVGTCSSSTQEYCLTTVVFTQAGSEIIRGCATRAECNAWINNSECNNVETHALSTGVTCKYCCSGDNCNHPPELLPATDTIYHAP